MEREANAVSALGGVRRALERSRGVYAAYIGLDVRKETIAVAVAECGRGEPCYYGEIANKPSNSAAPEPSQATASDKPQLIMDTTFY